MFRPGYPEVGPNNARLNAIKSSGGMFTSEEMGATFEPNFEPATNNIVITKIRSDAFYQTDLEHILHAKGIQHIVICGISTSGVVLGTALSAADRDYAVSVPREACMSASSDPLHTALLNSGFARGVRVVGVDEVLQALEA